MSSIKNTFKVVKKTKKLNEAESLPTKSLPGFKSSKDKEAQAGHEDPNKPTFTKAIKKLGTRGEGLLKTTALNSLKQLAGYLDGDNELHNAIDPMEMAALVKSFEAFVKLLGEASSQT